MLVFHGIATKSQNRLPRLKYSLLKLERKCSIFYQISCVILSASMEWVLPRCSSHLAHHALGQSDRYARKNCIKNARVISCDKLCSVMHHKRSKYLTTRREIFAFSQYALMIINVILPTMPGSTAQSTVCSQKENNADDPLILIWESGIKSWRIENVRFEIARIVHDRRASNRPENLPA